MDEADCKGASHGYEPIAIIGVGCRLPGGSSSPSKLWDMLKEGRSGQGDFPKNRLNIDAWYHPNANRPGSITTKGGYFLSHDDSYQSFDGSFFGINPLEAATLDPQQRKLLEVVYESFESAGATLDQVAGSRTSCYVGCFTHDHHTINASEPEYGAPYSMTGSDMTILSNRINYVFNLKGPSMAVDTACSSSLYALHLACTGLANGDMDAAIVGGTNIILGVEQQLGSVRLGVLSPTSTCHTFDETADGFGRGEGICAVYLKKLSSAAKAGDPIRAVIRGTAISANGRSQGISHPDTKEQERLIRSLYAKAGLKFEDTGYFECHGTGTKVGDPIEVAAIANVFAPGRTSDRPLLIGSIKPNVGHTEGASGIASVLKVVLAIENDLIPPTVGLRRLNADIDLRQGCLQIATTLSEWPCTSLKRASINSFGYGGANAHVIIESPAILLQMADGSRIDEAVDGATVIDQAIDSPKTMHYPVELMVLPFSAHDEPTLERNVHALAASADNHSLSDLAFTLANHRTVHRRRAFALAGGANIGAQIMDSVAYDETLDPRPTTIAFVFTGQGAQWAQMGYSLISQYPRVRETFLRLQDCLDSLPTPPAWTFLEELSKAASDSRVQEAELSQPLCTAIQIAITNVLRSWGVNPTAVVGHSAGEVAAAFAASLLTEDEAITVAYYRGISVTARHTPGAMLAVELGSRDAQSYIMTEPDVLIACHNSPKSVTLSGGEAAIDAIHESLVANGVFARKLNTSNNAYHSHLVKEAGQYYQQCFESSLPGLMQGARISDVPMYSCITGEALNSQNDVGIVYWRSNLESPVHFTQALSNLIEAHTDVNLLLEIGPNCALSSPIRDICTSIDLTEDELRYMPTLIRGGDSVLAMIKLAGQLYNTGYPIDLGSVNGLHGMEHKCLRDLPTYAWNYSDSVPWSDNRINRELRFRSHPRHDLLGSRVLGSSPISPEWRNRLKLKDVPWLEDHVVGDEVLLPAAGFVTMVVEAAHQMAEISGLDFTAFDIKRTTIKASLVIPPEGEVETVLSLDTIQDQPHDDAHVAAYEFRVTSVSKDERWTDHATGLILLTKWEVTSLQELAPQGHRGAASADSNDRRWYAALARIGLNYGPTFRTLSDIHCTPEADDAMARLNMESTAGSMVEESRYMIHPAALDGCIQLAVIAAHEGEVKEIVKAYLPTTITNLRVRRRPADAKQIWPSTVKSHGVRRGLRSAHGTSDLYNCFGLHIASIDVSLSSVEANLGRRAPDEDRQPYARLIWQPDIDKLSYDQARTLFPSGDSDPKLSRLLGLLEELTQLLLLTADGLWYDVHSAQPMYIKKYVDVLRRMANEAFAEPRAMQLDHAERLVRIQEIMGESGDSIPEVNLMLQMSAKLGGLLRGEDDALDDMLETSLHFDTYDHDFSHTASYAQLERIVSLIAHKEPRLKILEIGADIGQATVPMLHALRADSLMPAYTQYTLTDINEAALDAAREMLSECPRMEFRILDIGRDPLEQDFEAEAYDVILASNVLHATANLEASLRRCKTLLKPHGKLILIETTTLRKYISYILSIRPDYWVGLEDGRVLSPFISRAEWDEQLRRAGFTGTDISLDDYEEGIASNSIMVANVAREAEKQDTEQTSPEPLWLIYRDDPHDLVHEVVDLANHQGIDTNVVALHQVSDKMPKDARAIILAELEGPLLARMTPLDMASVRALFATASSLSWITGGALLQGKSPEHSLIFGIAKSIMTEQPSIRISSVDLDPDDKDWSATAKLTLQHEIALRHDTNLDLDTELIISKGIVYISRYIVDPVENVDFTRQLQPRPEPQELTSDLTLKFQQVGRPESYYFQDKAASEEATPGKDEVRLKPKSFALGKREVSILKGLTDADNSHTICLAGVEDIGLDVTAFKKGDLVVCFAPGHFDSSLLVPQVYCQLMPPDMNARSVILSLLPYCTALRTFRTLAGILPDGATVLVHQANDVAKIAFAHVAQLMNIKVIMSFESQDDQDAVKRACEIDDCRTLTISGRFETDLRKLLEGRRINAAIVSSGASYVPEIWTSLATNGRLIYIDSKVPTDMRLLDPSVFTRGASLTAIDIHQLIVTHPVDVAALIRRALMLMRNEDLPFLPQFQAFDVSALPQAIDIVLSNALSLSCALEYSPTSVVPVHRTPVPISFAAHASYLLVGCLGGLGRSLVYWMFARGARHFVFLSRSGADKSEAAELIAELKRNAARSHENMSVTVVKGDVANRADVNRAVKAAKSEIKGVVQQAMFLTNKLFGDMRLQDWQSVLNPKVQGTINLHEATLGIDLDFFVMTSSVLGAIGASTQSNYAAANAFLDNMARHRWSMDLQACSIALGMIVEVGHVEAHPDVEEALRRNGVYGIPEDEYLKMMENACRRRDSSRVLWEFDAAAVSHIVTGMEPGKISAAGGKSLWLQDNRVRHLLSATTGLEDSIAASKAGGAQTLALLKSAAAAGGEPSVRTIVRDLVLQKFSKLVLVPLEKLQASLGRPLTEFGMDSMITAEIRSWAWKELKADVPFMALLEGSLLLGGLVSMVWTGMDHSVWQE